MKRMAVCVGCLVLACPLPIFAYIGPGVGVTMIGWFVGFAVSMGAAVSALVIWPLRAMLGKRRKKGKAPTGEASQGSEENDQTQT